MSVNHFFTYDQMEHLSRAYPLQYGCHIKGNWSTIPYCTAAGGGAKLNAKVMNLTGYDMYFCNHPRGTSEDIVNMQKNYSANGVEGGLRVNYCSSQSAIVSAGVKRGVELLLLITMVMMVISSIM